jgi:hypothetical protein
MPCMVCKRLPSDPCHVKTWKITQSDQWFNIIPMCREHHQEQTKIGWGPFLERHPVIEVLLKSMGWKIWPKVGGGIHLAHDKLSRVM